MKGKWKALLLLLSVLLLGLIACRNVEVREESEPELKYVRIFDIEVQDEEDIVYQQHNALAGVLEFSNGQEGEAEIPFANQMRMIEKETGIQIEYVMLKSWDELPAKLEEAQMENVTAIVLFNNSFDGSLIREANSGKYADMEAALSELGFYDENAYNQTVLKAGMTEKGQVLVPILYNVPGMVQGASELYEYNEWKEMATDHAENGMLDYAAFLEKLKESMQTSDVDEMDVPFLSPAFLEGKVDLFLTASGADLEACEKQDELFTLLYNYLKCYDETQVKSKGNGLSNQMLYAQYIKENEEMTFDTPDQTLSCLTEEAAKQLQIQSQDPDVPTTEVGLFRLAESMLDRTDYFVECSAAEEVAYHSVFGTLSYRDYYIRDNIRMDGTEVTHMGNTNYWPIGVLNSHTEYAAQPICYAAVADGGSTRLAAEVLQSMLNRPTNVKYGISVCNQVKDAQLDEWKTRFGDQDITWIRRSHNSAESKKASYWGVLLSSGHVQFLEDREIFTGQVEKQIDNIVVARIPDREVLAIWQDALTEAVDSGLSAEAGFELLCERMEKRNMEE